MQLKTKSHLLFVLLQSCTTMISIILMLFINYAFFLIFCKIIVNSTTNYRGSDIHTHKYSLVCARQVMAPEWPVSTAVRLKVTNSHTYQHDNRE